MKGISHFAVGIAAASCIPGVVERAAEGNPLHFILAGIFGLLPDTLDFKFARFLHKSDMQIMPDPLNPDPQLIANAVALAVNRAHETGRAVNLRLHTVRLAADLWQSYEVKFDVAGRKVTVGYGPIVDTGGNPQEDVPVVRSRSAQAALACDIKLDYQATTRVDIFSGPTFCMKPQEKNTVVPEFIPWHRSWSHSIGMAFVFGVLGAAIWGWPAAAVIVVAYMAHVLVDQLGYLGSNIFFPFSKKRIPGFRLMHSGAAMGNLSAVWISCALIFWNLYAATGMSISGFSFIRLMFFGVAAPLVLGWGMRRLGKREQV